MRALRDEVEVSADALGCWKERRGQVKARPPGKLGWGQRIADGAQVVELDLDIDQSVAQLRQLLLVSLGFGT